MLHEPRVSVIVPIYNVEEFLEQCLRSIQRQSFSNIEVICINDGSTDSSISIIKSFAASDKRFIFIDKKNEGYGATCNQGIDLARGEYISIIEPDDYLDLAMYEEMLTFIDSFDQVIDIIKCPWFDVLNWRSQELSQVKPSYLYKRIITSKEPFALIEAPLLLETHPAIWSALYRSAFLKENRIRFPEYPGAGWADNLFLIDTLTQAKSIVFLNKPFYHYRNELPKKAKKTGSKIDTLPLQRWLEMSQRLKELSVEDKNVWKAHYLRVFNYLDLLAEEYDFSSLEKNEQVKKVFQSMDEDIVCGIDKLSPTKKKFYFEQRGVQPKKISSFPYKKHLAHELLHRVKAYGIGETLRSIQGRPRGFI